MPPFDIYLPLAPSLSLLPTHDTSPRFSGRRRRDAKAGGTSAIGRTLGNIIIDMTKYRFQTQFSDVEKYKLSLLMLTTGGPIIRKMRNFIIFTVVFSVCIFTYSNNEADSNFSTDIFILIYPTLLLLFIFVFPILFIKLGKTNNPTYEFDDNGMTIINARRTTNISWSKLDEFMETPNYILIKQHPSQLFSHVIKKASFSDNNDSRRFIDLLETNGLKRK